MTSPRRRAAIITPYGLFNYGNRLQNIAVDTTLKQHGFEVETLILKREYPRPVLRDIAKNLAHRLGIGGVASKKYRSFLDFNRPIRTRRVWSRKHLEHLGKTYDVVVCGSDQIWNPHQVNFGGAEYANFTRRGRRVALSPSFGVETIPQETHSAIATELTKFNALSAREFSGGQIIKDLTGIDAPVIIDPTMSLTAENWRARSDARMVPSEPYVFVYLLGKHEPKTWEQIGQYAAARGLRVVILMRKDQPEFYAAGPQDFLALIDNAASVITDSFHSSVFSLLFDTELFLVSRSDTHSMSSRFETLQRHLGFTLQSDDALTIGDRIVLDRECFNQRLGELRQQYVDYTSIALRA